MKVEIETQIEVTMKMNLREAKTIRAALGRAGLRNRGELFMAIHNALQGQEKE